MADVFVSYASEDQERVKSIVEAIEQAGISVWWDRRIGLGSSFDREIERELEAASCVVVIWSKRSIESDWVRNEAQEGLDKGVLLPILIENVRPPLAFRRTQAAQLFGRVSSEELSRVVAAIESIVTGSIAPGALRHEDVPSRTHRWPRYLSGLAAGVILLAAGFWWIGPKDSDLGNRANNQNSIAEQQPVNVMCQNMVQKARFGADSLEDMLDITEKTLALDPTCSGALAQKAFVLSVMAEFGLTPAQDGFLRAREAAEQALDLDPGQPLAHSVLGSVYMRIELDFQKAMDAFHEAERLGATAYELAGWKQDLLINAGRYADGLALMLHEEQENPLEPGSKVHTARFFVRMNRQDEARQKLAEALKLDLDQLTAERAADIYLHDLGELDKAQILIETSQLPPRNLQRRTAQLAFARGNSEPLRDYLEGLERGEDFPAKSWILWRDHYNLGNYEKHIHWFSVSVEQRGAVSWIMDFMNYRYPDYWQTLETWAAEKPEEFHQRSELLEQHKRLVMKVTEKMQL